jgi:NAD(P)-dependent dehydrogenase (short-subunit alcohol dehydrogenase family)
MNVNVTGVLRCTRALLPLLRTGERRGRVVNMSSIVRGMHEHRLDVCI